LQLAQKQITELERVISSGTASQQNIANSYNTTQHESAEDSPRVAENKYRSLVENTPALVYLDKIIDGDTAAVYVSPYIKNLLGYDPAEGVKNLHIWLYRIPRNNCPDRIQANIQNGSALELEAAGIWVS